MGQNTVLLIDDYDTSRLGFYVDTVEGWADSPDVRLPREQLAGRLGSLIASSSNPQGDDRIITISGTLKAATVAALVANRHQLKELFCNGFSEWSFADESNLLATGICQRVTTVGVRPQYLNPYCRVQARILCPDPLLYSKDGTSVMAGAVPQPCPIGTAPVAPLILVAGPTSNPVSVILRSATGEALYTMTLLTALGANDYAEIDCEKMEITQVVSGTRSSGAALPNGISTFPLLVPRKGDYRTQSWPTIEVTSGTVYLTYRKSWV